MYTLTFDGATLYDPRTENRTIREPNVRLSVGEAGSMSFVIDADHPEISRLRRMSGILELQADGTPIFRGRITKDTTGFDKSHTIEAEGVLAFFNDSVVEPFDFPGNGEVFQGTENVANIVGYFLAWLITNHNSQVSAEQRLNLGSVTVTDPNNYIARSSTEYATTMETLKSKILDTLGGYLLPRYEAGGTYIDYYAELPLTNTQRVEFAENLLDISQELDGTEIYTQILPIGADGLTIKAEPDRDITADLVKSGKIIYSRAGRALYGQITRVVSWDDVTLTSNLTSKAATQLANVGLATPETIQCTAVDLHCTDAEVAAFRVGRNVVVLSGPHGLSATYPLITLEPDIMDPGNTKITLGRTALTFTDNTLNEQRDTAKTLDRQNELIQETKNEISEINEGVTTQITDVVQTCRELILSAVEDYVQTGDFETYKSSVSSSLAVMAESVNINIQSITEQLTNVNNDLQSQISDITKSFRFTLDGIIIGESGNELLLRLDNDIIEMLRNNYPAMFIDEYGGHMDNLHVKSIYIGRSIIQGEENGKVTIY